MSLYWIQETAVDRYYERGLEAGDYQPEQHYQCRVCGETFAGKLARDQHEAEHPIQNPSIFVAGKELLANEWQLTAKLDENEILSRNVDYIRINGERLKGVVNLVSILNSAAQSHLQLEFGNRVSEKKIRIDVCIADPEQISTLERAFVNCFSALDFADKEVLRFREDATQLPTVLEYGNGLMRYIQGVMAKDYRSGSAMFESFLEKFTQATESLKQYDTSLSRAITAMVSFNRNDFVAINAQVVPQLDRAKVFFMGGELNELQDRIDHLQLPVDASSEFILTQLLDAYAYESIENYECLLSTESRKHVSLQDRLKIDYISWRKCIESERCDLAKKYYDRLRFDDVFAQLLERR